MGDTGEVFHRWSSDRKSGVFGEIFEREARRDRRASEAKWVSSRRELVDVSESEMRSKQVEK